MALNDDRLDRLNEDILRATIAREGPDLGAAERRDALRVAKAAYHGQTMCIDAVKAGIRYVKGRRDNG